MVANLVRGALALWVLASAGCSPGAPRLDCSSAETFRTSLEEMSKSLNADEKKQLAAAIVRETTAGMQSAAKEISAGKLNPQATSKEEILAKFGPQAMLKGLHGKTAKEILAAGDNANSSNSAPPPPPPPPPAAQ